MNYYFDVFKIRKDFPFFINNPDIIYLDSAATSHKPSIVIEKEKEFYEKYNCNVHRTSGSFSLKVEEMCENSRKTIANFLNCDESEIFFTYSATYGINYIAYFLCINEYLGNDDEVIITEMEHHANLLPFLNLSKIFGFKVKVWKMNEKLELDIEELQKIISDKTKLLAVTHMSNVLGVVNDIENIVKICKDRGLMVLVDGAQGIVHNHVDLKKWDLDFYVFSAHKLYGPLGLGVVYVNKKHSKKKKPAFSGGSMISYVSLDKITYLDSPYFFEPGTQAFAQIFAFKYAIEYLKNLNLEKVKMYEIGLTKYLLEKLKELDFVEIYGNYEEVTDKRFAIVPFNVVNLHSHDVSFVVDRFNVLIRVGHHCAQLIHHKLGIPGSCRVSIAFYNTKEDIDKFIEALKQVKFLISKN